MARSGARALVTGGAGFIGSHLIDALLRKGWQVTALDDLSTGQRSNLAHLTPNGHFRFVEGSVLDAGLVAREIASVDAVFHLAAAVGVQLIVDRPLNSLLVNIKGTENVFEAAAHSGVKVLITSSSEIYGKSQNGPFKEDDDRLLGSSRTLRWSYSISKSVDEILAYGYHREAGLPTVIARLFNTIGPRQVGRYGMVVPRFIAQALHGEPLTVYGDGTQSRVFTDVGDVVEALVRLIDSPQADGEAFNVAGHEEIRIRDLAELVIRKTGSASTVTFVPFEQAYGEGFEDMERRAAATTRLEAVTGLRCTTTLDETLDRMIAFARARPEDV
jgi:nucleoside-diphosphate-sugar epimerase